MEKLFYHGKIITMEEQCSMEEDNAEAVLIKDGVIKAVGGYNKLEEMASDHVQKIDLQGKCLMPAFIDTHSHFVMSGKMAACADLSECRSFEEISGVLESFIAKHHIENTQAVLGFGYDHNSLKENRHPDKFVLDEVSKEIPIMVLHISGHLACANSRALELSGISSASVDPEGGKIGRVGNTDEPSGYVEESALYTLQKTVADRMQTDSLSMLNGVQQMYLENGITTVQDGASTTDDIALLCSMSDNALLKVDVVAYPLINAVDREEAKSLQTEYHNRLKWGGYKLILDGSPQGRTAWMSEPYLGGEEGYCGYSYMTDENVLEYVKRACEEKKQLLTHCNGDAASDQLLRAYEKVVSESGPVNALRPVMIHCQTVRNDQLDKMAALGMIASFFIGHVWYWGDVHMKNFGAARGNHISPVRDALRRGVRVNFHQDTPVTRPDMLHSVWCAVNRISRKGETIGEDQKISVYEALRAVTLDAAYEYFEEDSKGSIKAGKRADLIILDKSPLEVETMDIRNLVVVETMKDGETVFSREGNSKL